MSKKYADLLKKEGKPRKEDPSEEDLEEEGEEEED